MNFGHPKLLWIGIALLPLLGLFLWATWRKRQALVRQFVQHKSLALATLGVSVARQKLRRWILLAAVALILFTVARPQWGFTWEEASQRGRDIIVAIDTSRSMLAEDIQPNRLARAKLAALDLLKLGQYDRFGLVAFSGSAFLQCPLTYDDEAFRQSVQILQTGIIPQGGTAIGEAIETARDAFGQDADENHRILVLFTDGEDHEQGASELVSSAVDAGMRIFTIGVGTPAGELLRTRDEQGNLGYVKDDAGNVVKSRLNEKLLQEIATQGRGFYLQLAGGNTMEVLYEKGLAPLPTSERTSKLMKRFKEQFYWPLAAAILLLILEVFLPDQKRAAKQKPGNASNPIATVVTLLALLLSTPSAFASPAKAQRQYKAGDYDRALSTYQELLGKSPNDPRLHYNAAAAAYQAGKFDLALKEFQAAAATPDLDLQQQAFYNLGNSEYRLGESAPNPQEKIAIWEQAVQHYEAALKLNASDKDAEFNRAFVQKKLEELKQQQQEQNKNQKKDNKDENREDQDDSSQEKQNNKDEQKKDEPSRNQDSQEQKQDNTQQEEQKQEQDRQKQQPEQQNQDKKDAEEKSDQSQARQGGEKDSENQKPESDAQGESAQLGRMTPAQAKQLLDAQRDEEKALIFIPQERKSDARSRSFKDW